MGVSAYPSVSLSGLDQSTSMAMEGDMDTDMDIDLGPVADLEVFQPVRTSGAFLHSCIATDAQTGIDQNSTEPGFAIKSSYHHQPLTAT